MTTGEGALASVPVVSDVRSAVRLLRRAFLRRRARREVAQELDRRGPLPSGHFRAVLYFADGPVNLYQVRQWYEPMRRLAERHPVVVVTRSPSATAVLLRECPLPVHHVSTIAELETWLQLQPVRVVFYVNQNRSNFSVLRFSDPAHVFVSHGESDKVYMASNQLKAYDEVFVAGPAAVRRIEANVHGLSRDRLKLVGRPQVDVRHDGPPMPADGRTVVLYAPTWEGDRPTMSYSSLLSHGPALVDALLADPRLRVVYRPHPRTGACDARYVQVDARITERLEHANKVDPAAQHVVDRGTPFGWQLQGADVCVTDVSAIAFDWLATGRPLLLTTPDSPDAVMAPGGLASRLEPFPSRDAGRVAERIERARARSGSYGAVVADYFGDTRPGASMARFLAAADDLIAARSRLLAPAAPAAPVAPEAVQAER